MILLWTHPFVSLMWISICGTCLYYIWGFDHTNKNLKKVMFNQNKVVILGFQMLFYFHLYHLESRWLSTPKRWRGLVRGYDKPWELSHRSFPGFYIQNDFMTHPFPFSTSNLWTDARTLVLEEYQLWSFYWKAVPIADVGTESNNQRCRASKIDLPKMQCFFLVELP